MRIFITYNIEETFFSVTFKIKIDLNISLVNITNK
jgi:hypothetical protein